MGNIAPTGEKCWIIFQEIYSFAIRYLSNSLANGTNAIKWGITNTSKCLFCNENQTLQHVISSCKISLSEKRWNYRHDSILLNIAKFISKIKDIKIYCDVENSEFLTPSIITGDEERPDIVAIKGNLCLILELTVGFETNIEKNSNRKNATYDALITRLNKKYQVRFVNLSMGGIGVIGKGCDLTKAFKEIGLDGNEATYLTRRMINVCIRTSYFLFCQRNKAWEMPTLLAW